MLIVSDYALPMKNAVRMHIFFQKNQFSFCKTTARQIGPLAVGSPLPERNLRFERSKKQKTSFELFLPTPGGIWPPTKAANQQQQRS